MGSSGSKAREQAAETKQEVDQMMMVLENKLEAMVNEIKSARGRASEVRDYEVAGGRTIMRVSEVRVATTNAPDQQILDGLNDFFSAAENGVDGENGKAKHAAIKGAQKLLTSGINALMGVQNGQSMEHEKFVILFLNNAFVRVDYKIYSYSISAQAWGSEADKAGLCYVADMAVLDMATLLPSEIDFLVSQALEVPAGDFEHLMQMKIQLIEVAILSRMLQQDNLTFDEVARAAEQLATAQMEIAKSFKNFADYEKGETPGMLKYSTDATKSKKINGTEESGGEKIPVHVL